jgi:hypothetical protein
MNPPASPPRGPPGQLEAVPVLPPIAHQGEAHEEPRIDAPRHVIPHSDEPRRDPRQPEPVARVPPTFQSRREFSVKGIPLDHATVKPWDGYESTNETLKEDEALADVPDHAAAEPTDGFPTPLQYYLRVNHTMYYTSLIIRAGLREAGYAPGPLAMRS